MAKEQISFPGEEPEPRGSSVATASLMPSRQSELWPSMMAALATLGDLTGNVAARSLHATQRDAMESAKRLLAASARRAERERERDAAFRLQLLKNARRLQLASRRSPKREVESLRRRLDELAEFFDRIAQLVQEMRNELAHSRSDQLPSEMSSLVERFSSTISQYEELVSQAAEARLESTGPVPPIPAMLQSTLGDAESPMPGASLEVVVEGPADAEAVESLAERLQSETGSDIAVRKQEVAGSLEIFLGAEVSLTAAYAVLSEWALRHADMRLKVRQGQLTIELDADRVRSGRIDAVLNSAGNPPKDDVPQTARNEDR